MNSLSVHRLESNATGQVILLTPPGPGAIAVIRLTGPAVPQFLKAHFSRGLTPGRCIHGNLIENNQIIDDAIALLLSEDRGVDLSVHGGPWVVRSVIDLARRSGFQELTPDDQESFGRLDGGTLIEREVMAFLPAARTQLGIRVLLAQLQAWPALEAQIQSAPDPTQIITNTMADKSLWWLLHPPRVAIIGAANVGKSTLANQLFAQQRSITADLPGTTRDWVGEYANIDGLPILLVDTPGLRDTTDPIECQAIQHSESVIKAADLVIVVIDATRRLCDQEGILKLHPGCVVIINKVDRGRVDSMSGIPIVATAGKGIDLVRKAIKRCFGCENLEAGKARYWTERQRSWLQAGLKNRS